jgi:AcrR family transcriptional regulator
VPLTSDLVPERVRVSQRQKNGGKHQWHLPSARASSRPKARRESGMTVPIKDISDGRQMRSERTRQALIKAYLDLLSEMQRPPTAPEIAKRAGCSLRSVFERFSDLLSLSLAATDYAFEPAMSQAAVPNADADLHIRLKSQVETRAAICERWLPLWRALVRYQSVSEELAIRIKRIRDVMVARLDLVYRPELSTLSEAEQTRLLIALDILTDFESWARMREDHGLSIEAARDLWINVIGRMLSAAAGNPAHSNPLASG